MLIRSCNSLLVNTQSSGFHKKKIIFTEYFIVDKNSPSRGQKSGKILKIEAENFRDQKKKSCKKISC